MNRLYVIKVGFLEIRGLISPGELPEVFREIFLLTDQYGATAEYLGNGHFQARKNGVQLELMIGGYYEAIPGPMLLDALDSVMEMVF